LTSFLEIELLTDELEPHRKAMEDADEAAQQLEESLSSLALMMKGVTSQSLATTLAIRLLQMEALEPGTLANDRLVDSLSETIRELAQFERDVKNLAGVLTAERRITGGFTFVTDDDVEENKRNIERMRRDLEEARDRLFREQVSRLDTFGSLIVLALRRQADAALRVELDRIDDAREAQAEAHRNRIREIEDELDTAIRAIEGERDARIDAIEDELGDIDDERFAEERAALERRLALAFDAKERARIQGEIRELDRRERERALRSQIAAIRNEADDEIEAARDTADARLEAARIEREEMLDLLRERETDAREAFAAITTSWALESAARVKILNDEQAEIIRLLNKQVPEWEAAGKSFGEALLRGLNPSLAALVGAGLADVPGTAAATKRSGELQAAIAQLQASGRGLKASGAPEVVIQKFRDDLIALGVLPEFQRGGIVPGQPGQPVAIMAHAGEIVVPAGSGGVNFNRGAFEGMFNGATVLGDRSTLETLMGDVARATISRQLGTGAFEFGVR